MLSGYVETVRDVNKLRLVTDNAVFRKILKGYYGNFIII